jgi:hypothetical protein
MNVHIREGDIHLLDVRTRMPFKYGIATMTSTPHLFLRLRAEVDGKLTTGIAADHLPPKWFTKDPARPVEEETHEMLRVIENALRLAVGVRGDTPFDASAAVSKAQESWGSKSGLPPLLTQFGSSLVERAMIEATCRATGRCFEELLRKTVAFGPRNLEALPLGEWLPPAPLRRITVRHTIGLLDPLTDEDIPPAERLDDGLPQSLVSCIRTYGLRHFKVKVCGSFDRDIKRLREIAAILDALAPPDYAFSLDGNEQFRSFDDFRAFWDSIRQDTALVPFFRHLLFVEQPLHRDVALSSDVMANSLYGWTDHPPMIIDESDSDPGSMAAAVSKGYAGTSHKNCKGVLKSLANHRLLKMAQRREPGRTFLMSGEDLANIGPVALLQDLTVCAALGIQSIERNGHHYFAGLSMFPPHVQEQVLQHHGDLYHRSRDGWPTLNIRNGEVDVGSLMRAPFGVGFEVPVERFLTPDQWRRANPLPERRPEGVG